MKMFVIIALACVWIALAVNAYSRGDTTMAVVFIIAGIALTGYRLSKY
jgi:hypothetical protein